MIEMPYPITALRPGDLARMRAVGGERKFSGPTALQEGCLQLIDPRYLISLHFP